MELRILNKHAETKGNLLIYASEGVNMFYANDVIRDSLDSPESSLWTMDRDGKE